jgi:hypothetical protein
MEILEAFAFLRGSGRKPPLSFRGMELLHIAFCVLNFPAKDAARKVIRYAFISDAFRLVHREYYAGASRVAVQGDAGWAVVILAKGVLPENHGKAWKRLRGFWKPDRLMNSLAVEGKLPQSWLDFSRGAKDQYKRLTEEMEAELAVTFGNLLGTLRHRDEDEVLGEWLDGEKRLTHLPNAAIWDVLNTFRQARLAEWREPGLEDETLKYQHRTSMDDAEEGEEAATELVSAARAATSPVHRKMAEGPPDAFASARVASERLERTVLSVFRHTKTERRLLRTILNSPAFDPFRHGAVGELAQISGCRRETASRYLSRLNLHKSAITKAFLG